MRGRFLRGVDVEDANKANWRDPEHDTRGASASSGNIGNRVGSVKDDTFGRHSHGYNMFPQGRGNIAPGRYWQAGPAQTSEAGGNETRPKNIYVNWIIKTR